MHETELRKHRCCFTGHRPEKLKIPEKRLAELLEEEIKRAIDSGHTTFITGMASRTVWRCDNIRSSKWRPARLQSRSLCPLPSG